MIDTHGSKPIKWAAELTHVREVSLSGVADLGYWRERLRRECLVPAEKDGHAQLLIIAGDLKFKGIRFREMSFCVFVDVERDAQKSSGAYLFQAFNTSRLLSFCERVFFSTPYRHGDVCVSASVPASTQLVIAGQCHFEAKMGGDDSAVVREPSHRAEDGWEGPVFLPVPQSGRSSEGRMFFTRVSGMTQTYAVQANRDTITIRPSPQSEVFQALLDSHFVAKEWILREDAIHAKSKTNSRAKMLPDMPTM